PGNQQRKPLCTKLLARSLKMAATAAATSAVGLVSSGATLYKSHCSRPTSSKVHCVRSFMSNAGLKPDNKSTNMGLASTPIDQFAYKAFKGRNCGGRKARTLGISCTVGGEIARIVPIMSALVLIGIAVGFVLLRIEAAVEESQE
ncbi:hypothetical protein KI387_022629, partial [Taxus chinensis]